MRSSTGARRRHCKEKFVETLERRYSPWHEKDCILVTLCLCSVFAMFALMSGATGRTTGKGLIFQEKFGSA